MFGIVSAFQFRCQSFKCQSKVEFKKIKKMIQFRILEASTYSSIHQLIERLFGHCSEIKVSFLEIIISIEFFVTNFIFLITGKGWFHGVIEFKSSEDHQIKIEGVIGDVRYSDLVRP